MVRTSVFVPFQNCVILALFLTTLGNAYRGLVSRELLAANTSEYALVAIGTNTSDESDTQFLCFGLCIAALGGMGAVFFGGLVTGGAVAIGYGAVQLTDMLTDRGFTNETLAELITNATRLALTPDSGLAGEDLMHKGAVTEVAWTPPNFLTHIAVTCGEFMEPKGLGASATSSRSGAMFWNCQTPSLEQDFGRVLVKGGIRDSDSSPEWQVFQSLAAGIGERYAVPTTLNKMLIGFDAFDLHWIVLEDIKATPLLRRLEHDLNVKVLEVDLPKFKAFDIKPAGSRAPQLPECFQVLRLLTTTMGNIEDFKGWSNIESALRGDLAFLQRYDIIDESLFVQVAGPFAVDERTIDAAGESAILEVLGGAPLCAYQVKDGQMAIVCITLLDYVLSKTFMKNIQNVFQSNRWDDYGGKVTTMLTCLGELSQADCSEYRRQAEGGWLDMVKESYNTQANSYSFNKAMKHLQATYRCCCNDEETGGSLTMNTACAWLRRDDEVTSFGFCPSGSNHYAPEDGGCMDLEPPPVPPPPATNRCGFFQSCYCYDADWKHDRLPVSQNGLCGCSFSQPRGYHEYSGKVYCPE